MAKVVIASNQTEGELNKFFNYIVQDNGQSHPRKTGTMQKKTFSKLHHCVKILPHCLQRQSMKFKNFPKSKFLQIENWEQMFEEEIILWR